MMTPHKLSHVAENYRYTIKYEKRIISTKDMKEHLIRATFVLPYSISKTRYDEL